MTDSFGYIEYEKITQGVKVSVFPAFLAQESDPSRSIYTYSYDVNIENLRSEPIKLLRRHWLIYQNQKLADEVRGEGVVGQQPLLQPREVYHYQSFVRIEAPVGQMSGEYFFQMQDGQELIVEIPHFDLIYLDTNYVH